MLVLIGIIGRLTSLSVGEIVYNLFTVKIILTYKVIVLILIKTCCDTQGQLLRRSLCNESCRQADYFRLVIIHCSLLHTSRSFIWSFFLYVSDDINSNTRYEEIKSL